MKLNILFYILLTFSSLAQAQLTINSSSMAVQPGTIVNTTTDLNINASRGLGSGILILSGQDQAITTANDLIIAGLGIAGGGIKTINGNVAISNGLQFVNGIIDVPQSSNLLIEGSATIEGYSETLYINGKLNREQNGSDLFFPIGKNGTYTPVRLSDVSGSGAIIALESFNEPITDITPPITVGTNYSQNWYWDLSVRDDASTFNSARITLPILEDDIAILSGENYKPVVLHKDFEGLTMNLDNSSLSAFSSDDYAQAGVSAGIGSYFLGFELLTNPRIHNIITPNDDGTNDFLIIDNLSLYPDNEVVLIDRYGVEVYAQENYVSPNSRSGIGEDFSFLPPGNYICILKYRDLQTMAELTAKQTISVIK